MFAITVLSTKWGNIDSYCQITTLVIGYFLSICIMSLFIVCLNVVEVCMCLYLWSLLLYASQQVWIKVYISPSCSIAYNAFFNFSRKMALIKNYVVRKFRISAEKCTIWFLDGYIHLEIISIISIYRWINCIHFIINRKKEISEEKAMKY